MNTFILSDDWRYVTIVRENSEEILTASEFASTFGYLELQKLIEERRQRPRPS